MYSDNLQQFKTWAIIALFSNDDLAEKFALKGGSALDLIYHINSRASVDIDVSMEKDFPPDELPEITAKLKTTFTDTFEEHGYTIFDFKFTPRPLHQDKKRDKFWGGYSLQFKIYPSDTFEEASLNMNRARLGAEVVGKNNSTVFSIDISKYEYCRNKTSTELEGFSIYVYTPEMIIYEKLRALCQQLPEYFINNGKFKNARPRDFYDIYTVMINQSIEFSDLNINTLEEFFNIKKVDLSLLSLLPKYYDVYIQNLPALVDTLTPEAQKVFDFDQCFNFVISGIAYIKK